MLQTYALGVKLMPDIHPKQCIMDLTKTRTRPKGHVVLVAVASKSSMGISWVESMIARLSLINLINHV